jgi:hypothetical protein
MSLYATDVQQLVETLQRTISQRVEEIVTLENQLDSEHADELRQIRTTSRELLQTQLSEAKEKTAKALYRSGADAINLFCLRQSNKISLSCSV